jgi:glycosyltransferase involved in cell wall biosynthesis
MRRTKSATPLRNFTARNKRQAAADKYQTLAPKWARVFVIQWKERRACRLISWFYFGPMNVENPEISLVIPCYNEEGNLRELINAIRESAEPLKILYEVVITDDCSKDKSWEILKELAAGDPRIRVQKFAFNCGESAASFAGLKAARGKYLFTLDADLQNDPKDLPKFLEALKHYDCVCGTRVKARGDGDNFVRIASSRIANAVRNKLSGEKISDAGCTYRAFKRECIENLKFFKGMHRFLPTLFKIEGHTVTEIEVSNNPRFAGQSNYGVWNRLFASFYDLLAVRWMKKRMFKYKIAEKIN